MTDSILDDPSEATTPITELSKGARRVLGVLVEKAFTTPEYYPMTLKAVTSGCNQKSNRHPTTEYSEDDVYDILEELRQLGLAAVVHTEGGRTERFRHYMRKRVQLSEPQLAILTELLLRGKQQMGELRSRASRMVPIETLEQLRSELDGLIAMNLVQANGHLDRRGVEVDHNLYLAREGMKLAHSASSGERHDPLAAAPAPTVQKTSAPPVEARPAASGESSQKIATLEDAFHRLQLEHRELREEMGHVRGELRALEARFEELKQALGG